VAEERDHILRDTEEDTLTGRRKGRFLRKEEERAEAEEGPVYPTAPEAALPEKERRKRRVKPKKKAG